MVLLRLLTSANAHAANIEGRLVLVVSTNLA